MRLDTASLLVVLVATAMLIACGASSDAPTIAVSSTCDAQYVTSSEAGNHLGQEVTVCGDVKDYYFHQTLPGKPTYLLFDEGELMLGFLANLGQRIYGLLDISTYGADLLC